ncbi:AGAP013204-PA-like protein [Anopheles sinensis]|uniref:AGAP013204-PA-like protein n=1 Tax=Anopheles sinensis TaxID=74873 RepID=A0A084WT39_ANOSI|nr:AGAP013204-PA-like protein [Anopheles sinensis]
MATAAKQSSSSSSPSNSVRTFVEGQEDLDAIAKQISDHAEAIYQTWKARGLAPTEILNCHTGDGAEHAFSQALNPANSSTVSGSTGSPSTPGPVGPSGATGSPQQLVGGPATPATGVAELLAKAPNLSNNSLEQLVSSFVNEDKARIAAQRQQQQRVGGIRAPSGTSSAIKSVLQKFERNGGAIGGSEPVSGGVGSVLPNYQRPSAGNGTPSGGGSVSLLGNNNNNNFATLNKNNVPDVLKDTIVEPKPVGAVREKPQTPVKPEHLLNHVPSWPLKNRVVKTGGAGSKVSGGSGVGAGGSVSGFPKNTADLMDEVSREEERLINALKTGTVLNSSDSVLLPEVITSTLPDRDVPDYGSVVDRSSGSGSTHNTTGVSASYSSQPGPTTAMVTAAVATNGGGPTMVGATPTNGTAVTNGNGTTNGTSNGTANHAGGPAAADAPNVKHWNGVPMKPNHIPILNIHQIREQEKLSMNFTRNVATTRLPKDFGRSGADDAEKKLGLQPKTIPSPIRPFLSRGSVAERVLIFEKCPEKAPPRERAKEPVKLQIYPTQVWLSGSL